MELNTESKIIFETFQKDLNDYYDNELNRINKEKGKKKVLTDILMRIDDLFQQIPFEHYKKKEKDIIYKKCISIIMGVFKHVQSLKTSFCNRLLINGFSEKNTVSICITKNNLEANEQWLVRLYKELKDKYPEKNLVDMIMVISSEKKNNLGGNATHCKNESVAWSHLKKLNNFQIIFVCSNKTRITDVFNIADSFLNLRDGLRKNVRIFHDEAHNAKEGLPVKFNRIIIENLLLKENVLSYHPITASIGDIVDENNSLWKSFNLEWTAINYTEFDNTRSDDSTYSSISDYEIIPIEELQKNEQWQNYNISQISRENFMKVSDMYNREDIDNLKDINLELLLEFINDNGDDNERREEIEKTKDKIKKIKDIDHRRTLEFCQFMKNDREKTALNNALNLLNLNNLLQKEHYSGGKRNIHIMNTPRRNIITHEICNTAYKMDIKPIVLGIYGSKDGKYHLFINGHSEKFVDKIVDNEMGNGEFNTKLYNLMKYLEGLGINTNCCWIIIGNYYPTGESISFVNYHYGTIKSVIKLISTNPEEDYQCAGRGNYMVSKFKENDSEWTPPPKYLIGEDAFINNALSIERLDDERVDSLEYCSNKSIINSINLPSYNSREQTHTKKDNTSIPVKIIMDTNIENNIYYEKLMNIARIKKKNENDKTVFINLLRECIDHEENDCYIEDKTGKLDLKNITLNGFRCYNRKLITEKGYWKFKNYQTCFNDKRPFINSKNDHSIGQCEILVCDHKYILKDENGTIIEENPSNHWWLSYKY